MRFSNILPWPQTGSVMAPFDIEAPPQSTQDRVSGRSTPSKSAAPKSRDVAAGLAPSLPQDVVARILYHADPKTVSRTARADKTWAAASRDIWRYYGGIFGGAIQKQRDSEDAAISLGSKAKQEKLEWATFGLISACMFGVGLYWILAKPQHMVQLTCEQAYRCAQTYCSGGFFDWNAGYCGSGDCICWRGNALVECFCNWEQPDGATACIAQHEQCADGAVARPWVSQKTAPFLGPTLMGAAVVGGLVTSDLAGDVYARWSLRRQRARDKRQQTELRAEIVAQHLSRDEAMADARSNAALARFKHDVAKHVTQRQEPLVGRIDALLRMGRAESAFSQILQNIALLDALKIETLRAWLHAAQMHHASPDLLSQLQALCGRQDLGVPWLLAPRADASTPALGA